jgi:hypothetical protein
MLIETEGGVLTHELTVPTIGTVSSCPLAATSH